MKKTESLSSFVRGVLRAWRSNDVVGYEKAAILGHERARQAVVGATG